MNRLEETFNRLRAEGRTALIPFVTVGHPSVEATLEVVRELVAAGADVVELGVPFSDPLAEGPTIQKSSQHALALGVSAATCIETAARLRAGGVSVPLVLMGYYNPLLAHGLDRYCADAAEAGVDGLIVADLPLEETGPLRERTAEHGLSLIPLVALTSPEARVRAACEGAGGFVYCVSVLGVTGARGSMSGRVRGLVEAVRRYTSLPVAVGFGISTAGHVRDVASFADAAIVGSALVEVIGSGPPGDAAKRAGEFLRGLSAGLSIE